MPYELVSKDDGKEVEFYTPPKRDDEEVVAVLLDAVFSLSAVNYLQFRRHFLYLDEQMRARS